MPPKNQIPFPENLKDWRGVPIKPGSKVIFTYGRYLGEGEIEGTYFKSGMIRVSIERSRPENFNKSIAVYKNDITVFETLPESTKPSKAQVQRNIDSHVVLSGGAFCAACLVVSYELGKKACGS